MKIATGGIKIKVTIITVENRVRISVEVKIIASWIRVGATRDLDH